ncbi:hypothetical protein [Sphingomonas sp.]
MRSLAPLLTPLLMLSLAACGSRGRLEPAEGRSLPPAPYGASETPTAADLMQPNAQQRPTRSDELLTDSQDRPNDPFDLPPPG